MGTLFNVSAHSQTSDEYFFFFTANTPIIRISPGRESVTTQSPRYPPSRTLCHHYVDKGPSALCAASFEGVWSTVQ